MKTIIFKFSENEEGAGIVSATIDGSEYGFVGYSADYLKREAVATLFDSLEKDEYNTPWIVD